MAKDAQANSKQLLLLRQYIADKQDQEQSTFYRSKYYPIAGFYKPEKLDQAIKNSKNSLMIAGSAKSYTDDIKAIHTAITDRPELLLGFISVISSIGNAELAEQTYKEPSEIQYNYLAKKYTEPTSYGEYVLIDQDQLDKELKTLRLQQQDIYLIKLPITDLTTVTVGKKDIAVTPLRYEAYKLAEKLGLSTKNKHRDLVQLATMCELTVALILAEMNKKGSSTRYTNIKGDGVGIPQRIIDAGIEGYNKIKDNPKLLNSLDTVFRAEADRLDKDGIAIQTQIFEGLLDAEGLLNDQGQTELAPWATVDSAIRSLNIAGTVALITSIRYLHKNPNGGTVTIKELMAYNYKYQARLADKRGLPKTDITAFGNSLIILLALRWGIKTKPNDRTTALKYYSLIDGTIITDDKTGEILEIQDIRYHSDFNEIANKQFYVLAPKGIDYLSSPEAQRVALKVQSLFANKLNDTKEGKPQQVTREWLAKGSYKINSRTNELIIEVLNNFVDQGLIQKWANIKGTKILNGYDKDTYKILLYPTTEAQESYITKADRDAIKKADKEIQTTAINQLKKALKDYGTKDEIAKYLDTTVREVELWIGKGKPIPKATADKISTI